MQDRTIQMETLIGTVELRDDVLECDPRKYR